MSEQNPALELAQRRIQELEDLIREMSKGGEQLHVLPNKDLHRGVKMERIGKPNVGVETIPESQANPLNRAMSKILTAAAGGTLTCVWCGLQYDGQGAEKDMREHLKKDHPSVVEGWDKVQSEVLMANLAEAQERLRQAEEANK